MDVQSSSQQELHKTAIYAFDEVEYDDDVFYKELRKQVLQLTAEDDESFETKNPNMQKQGQNYGATNDRGYYSWPGNKEDHAAPAWILNLWRTGNGTGVFIPQINAQARSKNRPRKKKNKRGRTYKGVEKMSWTEN
ncbi:uncharacterized protein LOC105161235 [Sesamum indicum]|uniref:Uncharacterized protein LOC105161235 n=1 Tax=Sesamum indicum TaxID=4182 RepID=A0A6I9T118_SESIN|nr:uncharacterized protein LOC105161235 [Sesamum indicum]